LTYSFKKHFGLLVKTIIKNLALPPFLYSAVRTLG